MFKNSTSNGRTLISPLVIILLILITFSHDNVLILLDYWLWTLLGLKRVTGLLAVSSLPAEPFFRWLDFGEYLCMLLRYSFEPMPNSRALGTTGSVITVGLSINECSHSKNQSAHAATRKAWRNSSRALLLLKKTKGGSARWVGVGALEEDLR